MLGLSSSRPGRLARPGTLAPDHPPSSHCTSRPRPYPTPYQPSGPSYPSTPPVPRSLPAPIQLDPTLHAPLAATADPTTSHYQYLLEVGRETFFSEFDGCISICIPSEWRHPL